MPPILVSGPAARGRIDRALAWLSARAPGEEVLVVGASADAANELLREAASARGAGFGWHRATLGRLAAELARPALVESGRVPVSRLGAVAVTARVLHEMAAAGTLGRYRDTADGPGTARAVARTLEELRLAGVAADSLADRAPELRAILEAYEAELARAGLADWPGVLAAAVAAASDPAPQSPLLGLPTLLLDLPLESAVERALVAAIAARAPDLLATAPAGDLRALAQLGALPGVAREGPPSAATGGAKANGVSLARLQAHLFEGGAPPAAALGDDVVVLSAPGESRECVEIARQILRLARGGTPFDQMAILLRSPEEYRPHLQEALERAGVPVHFARGTVQPDPAGRALLALLACAAEGLSARRFAEYLSLGQVPDATPEGAPPAAPPAPERWVAPDEELVPDAVAAAMAADLAASAHSGSGDPAAEPPPAADATDPERAPVTAGRLRAPRRWERLLVDAAVIGGRERWARRLDGLAGELALELEELDDPDGPAAERVRRSLSDLATLRDYALPLLAELAALPERAPWDVWLERLSALATRSLRQPERVLSVLHELAPMAGIGAVELAEVQLVLGQRLLELALPPARARYGRVFAAPAESARGLAFDVVFVPGLAEKLFPKKIGEDPILLDAAREALGDGLATNAERVARERLALRLAVGAARRRVVLSYPRLDLDQSRPRVPSFYALEALRAAEGVLPGFDELAARAEHVTEARVGWPAPRDRADAIDEAEHDLALLEGLLRLEESRSVGTARYLLTANPHLGRALRFRARRWLPNWTAADGLVPPPSGELAAGALEAMRAQRLDARSFSPTALQNYATCPYKFLLYAVLRLAPREVPEAIDELDPLQRGSLVHDAQYELFGRLEAEGLLPVRPENLAAARTALDEVLDAVAARHREELAPAIERVWEDAVQAVRADLREWLRRASEDASGFVPWRFELAFGLGDRRGRDPHSAPDPVPLDSGLLLRGSIDLVERHADGRVRVTDHKTGKDRVKPGDVLAGGEALQPVLYALAAEKLFPDAAVESGRLYYCTSAGGFEQVEVPLDGRARESAAAVARTIGDALAEPFLPAAPADGACRWCDYNVVCGPYEELRALP